MNENKRDRLFDLRTVERNIEHGLITREDYQAHLEGLDDSAEKGSVIEASFEVGVLDDDDEESEDQE